MDIKIREYVESDKLELEQLIQLTFPDDETMQDHAYYGPARSEPRHALTLVASRLGSIIGFASYFQNRLHYHPNDFRFTIVVVPEYQNIEIEKQLYDALSNKLPVQVGRLRTLTPETSNIQSFLESLGFEPFLQSYAPELSVETVNPEEFSNLLQTLNSNGYVFKTLAELDKTKAQERILKVFFEVYADTHTHSPPTQSENWNDVIFNDDVIDEAFFVVIKDNEIVAFSSLQEGESDDEMESMWDGVARSERALEFQLRLGLKLQEINYAKQQEIQSIAWEVDSVDLLGMQLIKKLPFTNLKPHHIWMLDF